MTMVRILLQLVQSPVWKAFEVIVGSFDAAVSVAIVLLVKQVRLFHANLGSNSDNARGFSRFAGFYVNRVEMQSTAWKLERLCPTLCRCVGQTISDAKPTMNTWHDGTTDNAQAQGATRDAFSTLAS
jgi:hypothetical protein